MYQWGLVSAVSEQKIPNKLEAYFSLLNMGSTGIVPLSILLLEVKLLLYGSRWLLEILPSHAHSNLLEAVKRPVAYPLSTSWMSHTEISLARTQSHIHTQLYRRQEKVIFILRSHMLTKKQGFLVKGEEENVYWEMFNTVFAQGQKLL